MKKFNLIELQNKGGKKMAGGHIDYLIGGLLLVVLASALAPTIFTSLLDINSSSAPSYVYTASVAVVGIGVVVLFWKAFGN